MSSSRWRLCVLLVITIIFVVFYINHVQNTSANVIYEQIPLPNLEIINVSKETSIFLIETAHRSLHGHITILPRAACAVESAARMNPNRQIFLIYSAPGTLSFGNTESDRMLKELHGIHNVEFVYIDYNSYTNGTPVEQLFKTNLIAESKFRVEHYSDVLRLLTLYKYGGIYLDTDTITIKSLEGLGLNYAGFESGDTIGNCILSFDYFGDGHGYVKSILEDINSTYRNDLWSHNGPGGLSRFFERICGKDLGPKTCKEFTFYKKNLFYPIAWQNWKLFMGSEKMSPLDRVKDSYIVHFWNKMSGGTRLPVRVEVPYTALAKKFCPNVFEQCKTIF